MDKATRRYSSLIITYVGRQPLQVAFLAIALLGGIVCQLLNPQILRYFIDTATARGPLENLSRAALLFIGVALVQQILAVLAAYFGQSVGWTATNLLRADLLAHCIKLDMSFHKQHTSGEMVERIDGDVNELSNFLSSFAIKILGNLLLLAGVLVLLFLEDWRIGLTMSAFSVLVVVALRRVSAIVQPLVAEHRQVAADFYGFIEEHISSTEDIRSSGASNYSLGRFYTFLQHWLPVRRRADLSSYGTWIASISIFAFGTMVALGLGAYLWSQNLITIGSVYMIFYYTGLLRSPLEEIRTQFQDLQRALASTDRVYNLLHTSSQVQDGPGATLSPGPVELEFRDVGFAYEGEDMVLERISFCLAPGTVLGLLGRTGSGKTTLARLVMRLYDSSSGEILINGVPYRSFQLHQLRGYIGMVTQTIQIFQASVRDNLTLFDRSIPDSRIVAVLTELGLEQWYHSLPHGLDTMLAARDRLSAGEAQLLAFGRVFLTDPSLVILDEATSNLDYATEQLIDQAITKLLQNRTAIIIAHRLSTVQRADTIMILSKGQICEYGAREELEQQPDSQFAQLLQHGLSEVLA